MMYVRWKRRPLTHTYDWGNMAANPGKIDRHALDAVLAETVRQDGRVRQRMVKHLGHVEARWVARPADRFVFWMSANRALADVSLTHDQRQRIEDKLGETVGPVAVEVFVDPDEWNRLVTQSLGAAIAALCEVGPDLDAHEAMRRWDVVRTREAIREGQRLARQEAPRWMAD